LIADTRMLIVRYSDINYINEGTVFLVCIKNTMKVNFHTTEGALTHLSA